MATSKDIRAGGAFVELFIKGGTEVEKQLQKFADTAERFANALSITSQLAASAGGQFSSIFRGVLKSTSDSVDGIIERLQKLVTETGKALSSLMTSIPSGLSSLGGSIQELGMSVMAAASVMDAGFVYAGKSYLEFERQMSRVKAISGAFGESFDKLTEIALELGRRTEYTATQAAEGLAYLSMAGVTAVDQLGMLPVVLDLSTAAMLEMGQTADIVTDIGMAFGYMGRETERVADVLSMAASNSNTTIPMMAWSFKYLSSYANAAGQSIEDMAASVALLATSGIKGSTAGTGIREALAQMVSAPKRKKLWELLGVDISTATGDVKPFLDIIKELKVALAPMGRDQQLALMSQIFGRRGGNVVLSLINRSNQAIDEMRFRLYDADGACKQLADTMRNNLWGSFHELISAAQDVALIVGGSITPAVRNVMGVITDVIRAAGDWARSNGQLIVTLALTAGAATAAGAAFFILGRAIRAVAIIIRPVFIAAALAVRVFSATVAGLIGLFKIVTIAVRAFGMAFFAIVSVLQSVALAFAALSVGLSMLTFTFTTVISAAVHFMKAMVWIASLLPKLVSVVSVVVKEFYHLYRVFQFVVGITGQVAKGFMAVVVSIMTSMTKGLVGLAVALLNIAMLVASLGLMWAGFSMAMSFAGTVIVTLTGLVSALATAFGTLAVGVGGSLLTAFVGVAGVITGVLSPAFAGLLKWLSAGFDGVRAFISLLGAWASELYDVMSTIAKAIVAGDFQNALKFILTYIQLKSIDVINFIKATIRAVMDAIPSMAGRIQTTFFSMVDSLKTVFSTLWRDIAADFDVFIKQVKRSFLTAAADIVLFKGSAFEMRPLGSEENANKNIANAKADEETAIRHRDQVHAESRATRDAVIEGYKQSFGKFGQDISKVWGDVYKWTESPTESPFKDVPLFQNGNDADQRAVFDKLFKSAALLQSAAMKLAGLDNKDSDPFKNVPKFAEGGVVGGTGTQDNVPALLTPGEYVIPRDDWKEIQKSDRKTWLQRIREVAGRSASVVGSSWGAGMRKVANLPPVAWTTEYANSAMIGLGIVNPPNQITKPVLPEGADELQKKLHNLRMKQYNDQSMENEGRSIKTKAASFVFGTTQMLADNINMIPAIIAAASHLDRKINPHTIMLNELAKQDPRFYQYYTELQNSIIGLDPELATPVLGSKTLGELFYIISNHENTFTGQLKKYTGISTPDELSRLPEKEQEALLASMPEGVSKEQLRMSYALGGAFGAILPMIKAGGIGKGAKPPLKKPTNPSQVTPDVVPQRPQTGLRLTDKEPDTPVFINPEQQSVTPKMEWFNEVFEATFGKSIAAAKLPDIPFDVHVRATEFGKRARKEAAKKRNGNLYEEGMEDDPFFDAIDDKAYKYYYNRASEYIAKKKAEALMPPPPPKPSFKYEGDIPAIELDKFAAASREARIKAAKERYGESYREGMEFRDEFSEIGDNAYARAEHEWRDEVGRKVAGTFDIDIPPEAVPDYAGGVPTTKGQIDIADLDSLSAMEEATSAAYNEANVNYKQSGGDFANLEILRKKLETIRKRKDELTPFYKKGVPTAEEISAAAKQADLDVMEKAINAKLSEAKKITEEGGDSSKASLYLVELYRKIQDRRKQIKDKRADDAATKKQTKEDKTKQKADAAIAKAEAAAKEAQAKAKLEREKRLAEKDRIKEANKTKREEARERKKAKKEKRQQSDTPQGEKLNAPKGKKLGSPEYSVMWQYLDRNGLLDKGTVTYRKAAEDLASSLMEESDDVVTSVVKGDTVTDVAGVSKEKGETLAKTLDLSEYPAAETPYTAKQIMVHLSHEDLHEMRPYNPEMENVEEAMALYTPYMTKKKQKDYKSWLENTYGKSKKNTRGGNISKDKKQMFADFVKESEIGEFYKQLGYNDDEIEFYTKLGRGESEFKNLSLEQYKSNMIEQIRKTALDKDGNELTPEKTPGLIAFRDRIVSKYAPKVEATPDKTNTTKSSTKKSGTKKSNAKKTTKTPTEPSVETTPPAVETPPPTTPQPEQGTTKTGIPKENIAAMSQFLRDEKIPQFLRDIGLSEEAIKATVQSPLKKGGTNMSVDSYKTAMGKLIKNIKKDYKTGGNLSDDLIARRDAIADKYYTPPAVPPPPPNSQSMTPPVPRPAPNPVPPPLRSPMGGTTLTRKDIPVKASPTKTNVLKLASGYDAAETAMFEHIINVEGNLGIADELINLKKSDPKAYKKKLEVFSKWYADPDRSVESPISDNRGRAIHVFDQDTNAAQDILRYKELQQKWVLFGEERNEYFKLREKYQKHFDFEKLLPKVRKDIRGLNYSSTEDYEVGNTFFGSKDNFRNVTAQPDEKMLMMEANMTAERWKAINDIFDKGNTSGLASGYSHFSDDYRGGVAWVASDSDDVLETLKHEHTHLKMDEVAATNDKALKLPASMREGQAVRAELELSKLSDSELENRLLASWIDAERIMLGNNLPTQNGNFFRDFMNIDWHNVPLNDPYDRYNALYKIAPVFLEYAARRVKTAGKHAEDDLMAVWDTIQNVSDLTSIKSLPVKQRARFAKGGRVGNIAATIPSFGTDTVPAMLTPGEFVVNRTAAQEHFELLKAINGGKAHNPPQLFSKGGFVHPIPFATGGSVPAAGTPVPPVGSTVVVDSNALLNELKGLRNDINNNYNKQQQQSIIQGKAPTRKEAAEQERDRLQSELNRLSKAGVNNQYTDDLKKKIAEQNKIIQEEMAASGKGTSRGKGGSIQSEKFWDARIKELNEFESEAESKAANQGKEIDPKLKQGIDDARNRLEALRKHAYAISKGTFIDVQKEYAEYLKSQGFSAKEANRISEAAMRESKRQALQNRLRNVNKDIQGNKDFLDPKKLEEDDIKMIEENINLTKERGENTKKIDESEAKKKALEEDKKKREDKKANSGVDPNRTADATRPQQKADEQKKAQEEYEQLTKNEEQAAAEFKANPTIENRNKLEQAVDARQQFIDKIDANRQPNENSLAKIAEEEDDAKRGVEEGKSTKDQWASKYWQERLDKIQQLRKDTIDKQTGKNQDKEMEADKKQIENLEPYHKGKESLKELYFDAQDKIEEAQKKSEASKANPQNRDAKAEASEAEAKSQEAQKKFNEAQAKAQAEYNKQTNTDGMDQKIQDEQTNIDTLTKRNDDINSKIESNDAMSEWRHSLIDDPKKRMQEWEKRLGPDIRERNKIKDELARMDKEDRNKRAAQSVPTDQQKFMDTMKQIGNSYSAGIVGNNAGFLGAGFKLAPDNKKDLQKDSLAELKQQTRYLEKIKDSQPVAMGDD